MAYVFSLQVVKVFQLRQCSVLVGQIGQEFKKLCPAGWLCRSHVGTDVGFAVFDLGVGFIFGQDGQFLSVALAFVPLLGIGNPAFSIFVVAQAPKRP